MGKNLGMKAAVLLVVIFFHSFVLVPKSYATVPASAAGLTRVAFNAMSPQALWDLAVANEAKAMLVGVRLAGAIGLVYYLYDSGALDKLKDWVAGGLGEGVPPDGDIGAYTAGSTTKYIFYSGGYLSIYNDSGGTNLWYYMGYPQRWQCTRYDGTYYAAIEWAKETIRAAYGQTPAYWGTSPPAPPSVKTDYTGIAVDPQFVNGTVWGSPGAGSLLPGIASSPSPPDVVTAEAINPGDVDAIKNGLGLTEVDPNTGVQPDTVTDNTVTRGDQNTNNLLGQILSVLVSIRDYASNLLGIKSSMDNVAVAINNQTAEIEKIPAKLDNVIASVESLKETTATESTISTRLSSVKTLLLTKFPFSIVAAVTSPGSVTGGTYSIPDLHFPLGHTVSVDPMQNAEMASWITWLRNLFATGMWAIFILVMVRRATQI